MHGALPARPLRYHPDVETREVQEEALTHILEGLIRNIQETTLHHYGVAMRGLQTKSHGLLEGEMVVLDGLPEPLAQGLFAKPGRYPVIMRLSTNRGDIIDDDISVPRGLAVKVIGVSGERLPGADNSTTQDFVFVNQPAFTEPDLKVFVRNLSVVDATTDTGLAWKKALGAGLRPVVAGVRALGGKAWTLTTMGGHPLSHPLGDTYYTQVPFRHGDYVAKLALAPVAPSLAALQDRPLDLTRHPNGIRAAIIDYFRTHGAVWELRVQLRTNPRTMPIEDASVVWPQEESPYRAVARIAVSPQPAWSEARARQVDDGLVFNPWNGLAAHQPLGAVNRARRVIYPQSAAFRARHNGCPVQEPRGALRLSDAPPEVFSATRGREGRRPGTPDARPGTWSAPMRPTARYLHAGAIGAAAGGVATAALALALRTRAPQRSSLAVLLGIGGLVAGLMAQRAAQRL